MSFLKKISNFAKGNIGSTDFLSLAFLKTPIATVITDDRGTILHINNSFTKLMGYTEIDCFGKNMSMLKSGEHDHTFYKTFYKKINELDIYTTEIKNRSKNGVTLLLKESISKIQYADTQFYVLVFEDITEQKKLSVRYEYLATHDPLTGLANRTLLKDRFNQAIYNATRSRKKLALLMCDLNEFKQINDNYGHHIGDITLQKVAQKLQSFVRAGDTIARCGGDEFVIILEHLESADEIKKVVDKLQREFPLVLQTETDTYEIGVSIGCSHFPEEGTTYEQLSSQADRKMYDAKNLFYGTN